ncbi:hypothetical protein HDC92_004293 [Pedobacter sp. AK017]|uniref:hypothetical protein n=1 Tax=Pedobacter sp. AK017 TaxID=2723073 RepID=UPI00161D738D|nr:hypothetical protein [Pedobacter sp. AK017]MBB5440590.1 hypothetical protein [Pedobacter sp. AK017]
MGTKVKKTKKVTGCFLKFGEKQHLESLLKKGSIFCRPMHYFANLKDENFIGDKYETVFAIKNILGKIEYKNGADFKPLYIGPLQQTASYFPNQICGNLFCLYFHDISHQVLDVTAGGDIDHIKEWVILIIDAQEFKNRIESALKFNNMEFESRFVEYEDFSKYNGWKSQFKKDIGFTHQKEFRFWIKCPVLDDYSFEIGSIEDIARLMKSEELKSMGFKKIGSDLKSHFEKQNDLRSV